MLMCLFPVHVLFIMWLCTYTIVTATITDHAATVLMDYEDMAVIHYNTCIYMSRCDGTNSHVNHTYNPREGTCCWSCSCSDSCLQNGTCCPDKLAELYRRRIEQPIETLKCMVPALRQDFLSDTGYWMRQSCSATYSNMTVRRLCLGGSSARFKSLKEAAPVTAKNGTTLYYNIYCALCNDISENNVIPWQYARLQCEEGVFFPDDETYLLDNIDETKCNVVYSDSPEFAKDMYSNTCTPYLSKCNITGLWSKYDAFLEKACQSYTSVYMEKYRNLFCYMCNEMTEPPLGCVGFNPIDVFTQFSSILNFIKPKDAPAPSLNEDECTAGKVYDAYQRKCLKIHCYFGGQYTNGTCVQEFSERLYGLNLQANLKLTPEKQPKMKDAIVVGECIRNNPHFVPEITSKTGRFDVCGFRLFYEYSGPEAEQIKLFEYEIDFLLRTFPTSLFIEKIISLHKTKIIFSCMNESMSWNVELAATSINDVPKNSSRVVLLDMCETTCCIKYEKRQVTNLPITRIMHCPFVKLDRKDFTWKKKGSDMYIKEIDLAVPGINFVEQTENDTIYVCMNDYFPKVIEVAARRDKNGSSFDIVVPVGYLTFACVMLSVCCLVVTLVTYTLFAYLRTQPGINNIILASTLIIAQCLFQFGVGVKEDVPRVVCIILGMSIHLSWLFVVFWMGVCSLHMARVFRRSMQERAVIKSKAQTSLSYSAFAFVFSTLFVVVNISLSATRSSGSSLGYADGSKCYISSNLMLGITFALPVALVVVVNFCLLLYTVCRIAEANSKNRNFLVVYLRLTTITGLTWVFGFIFIWTNIVVFEYAFALLNAGQGVLIMLAFVTNKRVLGMYKNLVRKENFQIRKNTDRTDVRSNTEGTG